MLAPLLVTGVLALGSSAASADTVPCPGGGPVFFAVDGVTGHLHEVCRVQAVVHDLGVVDTDDWRDPLRLTVASSGGVTDIFAVTGDGRLLRRSRPGPGQPFGPPVEIGQGHDWSTAPILLATPATIVAQLGTAPDVRVFRLTAGGLTEGESLFDAFDAPGLTGLSAGFAELNHDGRHFRIFRGSPLGGANSAQSYFSGALPSGLVEVSGTELTLAGLDYDGRIVTLKQDWKSLEVRPGLLPCFYNPAPWTAAAMSAGAGFVRLVVPGRIDPFIRVPPTGVHCPDGVQPWEWQ